MSSYIFSSAKIQDAAQIAALVNMTYRGDSSRLGWTSEADLLEGLRTDGDDIARLINSRDSVIITATAANQLLGSILIQYADQSAELGMFSVLPSHQNQGIGNLLLQYAEQFSTQTWPVQRFLIAVIPCRHELIAYYQRRGYRLNGQTHPFPVNPKLWTPKVDNLTLAYMEKTVNA